MFVGEKVYNWNGTRWDLTCTEKWYYSEPKELNIVEINGKNINIYPNPTNGILFIECESFSTIKLYNMLGKDVLTQTANGKTEINISHLPNGICNVIIF